MARKIVVLGGGISGLSAAWFLKQRHGDAVEVTVLESSGRFGGWIQTVRHEGFLFELGPRSCRAHGSGIETLKLIEELDLQNETVVASPAARKRFLYTGRRLRSLPKGPLSFFLSSVTRPLLLPLLREFRIPPANLADESIHHFFERRLGSYAACTFADPLVSGIFAGDPRRLSLKSCFPLLHQWEMDRGSIVKGLFARKPALQTPSSFVQSIAKQGLFSLKNGMQQLVGQLCQRLDATLRIHSQVESLERSGNGIIVRMVGGETLVADHVISALPAHALATLIRNVERPLASLLHGVRCASVAVVSVGYRKRVLTQEGFGYLIPFDQGERVLGTVWDSSVFPQQNSHEKETRLTCMIGGEQMASFESYVSEDFKAITLEAIGRHLGITAEPDVISVQIAKSAIPQYNVGHGLRVSEIHQRIADLFPSMTLIGNSFEGVSVNDCIANAKVAVQDVL